MIENPEIPPKTPPQTVPETQPDLLRRRVTFRSVIKWLLLGLALLWSLAVLTLVAARWIDPPTTAVHMERRLQAWIHRTSYHERTNSFR